MKKNDYRKEIIPNWVTKKSTIAVFLKKQNCFVIRSEERFEIKKFALFICTENRHWSQMTADMFDDEATVFFFNVQKEKAFLEKCSGIRDEIKKMYFVWEEFENAGRKGLFLEKKEKNYSLMCWDSSFMDEANQLISRELLKAFFTIIDEKKLVEEAHQDDDFKMIPCMDQEEDVYEGERA